MLVVVFAEHSLALFEEQQEADQSVLELEYCRREVQEVQVHHQKLQAELSAQLLFVVLVPGRDSSV